MISSPPSRASDRASLDRSEQAGARSLFTTGPDSNLDALAKRDGEHGLELTSSGLYQLSVPGPGPALGDTEAVLYPRLGLEPVPAELRYAQTLHENAGSHADLLAPTDICGMVHCHTTYSDGKNSTEEMELAVEALGMQYLTITDHSQSAHYARGVALDRLMQQWGRDRGRAGAGERAVPFAEPESDILADGSLDYPDAVLEQFDVAIASIHARFKLDRAGMTKRADPQPADSRGGSRECSGGGARFARLRSPLTVPDATARPPTRPTCERPCFRAPARAPDAAQASAAFERPTP